MFCFINYSVIQTDNSSRVYFVPKPVHEVIGTQNSFELYIMTNNCEFIKCSFSHNQNAEQIVWALDAVKHVFLLIESIQKN